MVTPGLTMKRRDEAPAGQSMGRNLTLISTLTHGAVVHMDDTNARSWTCTSSASHTSINCRQCVRPQYHMARLVDDQLTCESMVPRDCDCERCTVAVCNCREKGRWSGSKEVTTAMRRQRIVTVGNETQGIEFRAGIAGSWS